MSESWLAEEMYCVRCGRQLRRYANNHPFGDIYCAHCGESFELKSVCGKYANRIPDGAYAAMIAKIARGTAPSLFYLSYDREQFRVNSLMVIPNHYLTGDMVIKRNPLQARARRHGWVGCFIDISRIPASGKIAIIDKGKESIKTRVIDSFNHSLFLRKYRGISRSWLVDVAKIIEEINKSEFELDEIYHYEKELKLLHPANNHIKAKIRQQLQKLKGEGYLEFRGNGKYRRIRKDLIQEGL